VVCGHSLGAGVAALLAQHLHTMYPNLYCWAFAPMGGFCSPAGSLGMKPYCTSVVVGKDMIPRISLR
jgi:sn1-specific diacylglycerol lipase